MPHKILPGVGVKTFEFRDFTQSRIKIFNRPERCSRYDEPKAGSVIGMYTDNNVQVILSY